MRSVQWELFHADGRQTERERERGRGRERESDRHTHTHKTKLIVALLNFADTPKI
jgi:hypothetical protein